MENPHFVQSKHLPDSLSATRPKANRMVFCAADAALRYIHGKRKGVNKPMTQDDKNAKTRKDPPALEPEDEFYAIRILRDGTWLYNGTPIKRHNLVKLFSTVLKKDEKGGYWLVTPYEKGRIEVDDAPFTAVEMKVSGTGRDRILHFRTNVDIWVEAGPEHPLRVTQDAETGAPSPYVRVRDNLEALVTRAVYYDLVALCEESADEKGLYGLWSHGKFYPVGRLDPKTDAS
jgi:hypothetical protein